MGIRKYRPTNPASRFATVSTFEEVTTSKPSKKLTEGKPTKGGRNNKGRISVRFRGGGHKQRYRQIDFKRNKIGVPARVASLQYDPNRTARIALLHYADGEKRYILAPDGLVPGDTVISSRNADIRPGNSLPLKAIPTGTMIHAIELKIGAGAQMVRSAGTAAQLMAKEGNQALLRLPSGEVRKVHANCRATIGQLEIGSFARHLVEAAQNSPVSARGGLLRRQRERGQAQGGQNRMFHQLSSPPETNFNSSEIRLTAPWVSSISWPGS